MPLEGVSGISAAIGYAAESTWGTSVAPSKWTEFLAGETLGRKQNYQRSAGIKAGRVFVTGGRTAATTRTAGGNLALEVGNQGMGAFFNLLHGETVTPVKIGGGLAYEQVHKIGTTDAYKKSMSIVKAAPKTEGGTVDSYCYSGSILNSLEFACATNGFLVATMAIDAKDEDQTQSIGTVSYPAGIENFSFVQCEVKVNSVAQKAFHDLKMTFTKPTDVARFFLGTATRSQPLTNAFNSIKLDFTADYESKTLYEMFKGAETKKVEVIFTGATASEANKFKLEFVFPMCRFEGDSPNVKDLGPLEETIPLMVEDNGTEPPCTLKYVSLDSAL